MSVLTITSKKESPSKLLEQFWWFLKYLLVNNLFLHSFKIDFSLTSSTSKFEKQVISQLAQHYKRSILKKEETQDIKGILIKFVSNSCLKYIPLSTANKTHHNTYHFSMWSIPNIILFEKSAALTKILILEKSI